MNNFKRVIKPDSVPEQLLYSTVRISSKKSTGTGFCYNFKVSTDKKCELILTNKHVIEGDRTISIHFHEAINNKNEQEEPTNESFLITLNRDQYVWVPHPNGDIDLGAILLTPIKKYANDTLGKKIFNTAFDETLIKNDEELMQNANVADEVLMVGYPSGLWDCLNNFPLIRKGITASHPSLDFQGKSIGVVDIACIPGSSGSPILLYSSGFFYDKSSKSFKMGETKVIFIGLLYSGPTYDIEGKIEIKEIPTQLLPVPIHQQLIHLGYYVKAKEILILCEEIRKFIF